MGLDAYEAGRTAQLPPAGPLIAAAENERGCTPLPHIVKTWHANGGGTFTLFSTSAPAGPAGDQHSPGSPEWDAAMSMIFPPGDATLDGKAISRIFESSRPISARGVWWEQGDSTRTTWSTARTSDPDGALRD